MNPIRLLGFIILALSLWFSIREMVTSKPPQPPAAKAVQPKRKPILGDLYYGGAAHAGQILVSNDAGWIWVDSPR